MKSIATVTILFLLFSHGVQGQKIKDTSTERRQFYLELLNSVLESDQIRRMDAPTINPEDSTWSAWLKRSGELPPDFSQLPSLPNLPNPLILDEGGENIPVESISQWKKKRDWIREQAAYWITGSFPPAPSNLRARLLEERMVGKLREEVVLLEFGPGHKAKLHISLLFPPGDGPFPVFICPWKENQYNWVQAAVRRGYIGVRFSATDPKYGLPDDSETYRELWWPEFDFTTLGRWAWAASRAIDYLYTLPYINKEQLALTGLSRNGKMALWAAAYDERIKAVVPISGGTGGENPFRYTSDIYNNETIELLTRWQPHWLHPRLRFFVGREHKLPVDQNLLMAMIAPRGLMLTSSITESAGNSWGIEQAYLSAKKAYDFLGKSDHIALDLRQGLHAPSARDMERYLDFFDNVFGRGEIKPENKLYHDYTFSKWLGLSGEVIDPMQYEPVEIDDLLLNEKGDVIQNKRDWEQKAKSIKAKIQWGLGKEPPAPGPGVQPDYMRAVVGPPAVKEELEVKPISFGNLYYLKNDDRVSGPGKMPVMVFLHEFSYSKGMGKTAAFIQEFTRKGFAVYVFDQIGFGTRLEEGRLFYERFPNWSKLGRMVADVRWAIDELLTVEFLDQSKILVAGYSLGGTVALYSAALDKRIAGVASIAGFTPMRTDQNGKTAEGIFRYAHLHGLLPRLGFFVGHEERIPYDYHEILGAIAPRPLLVVAPTWDQYHSGEDVGQVMNEVQKVFALYGLEQKVKLIEPEDYNRFSPGIRDEVIKWSMEVVNRETTE
jgi:pimeloyl-ACP methyl ester carboxylesterase